jgi:signal peptidase I
MPSGIAGIVRNDAMEPTLPQGAIIIASLSSRARKWSIIAYRSALTVADVCRTAKRSSEFFRKLSDDQLRELYTHHFRVFGPVRINRIARIVGLEGERISIRERGLFVDGRMATPPSAEVAALYRNPPASAHFADELVPAGYVFVLKDNLKRVNLPRTSGPIKLTSIVGSVVKIMGTGQEALGRLKPELLADLVEQHGPVEGWGKPH